MIINYYRKMKNVERMSGTFKHRPYNLLEHSYMVLAYFKHFASIEDVPYDMKVLDLVMHHDILETETGDLIHPVKKLNQRTNNCWKIIEDAVIDNNPPLFKYSDNNIISGMNSRQYALFKACDYLDLFIFCKEEISFGNKGINLIKMVKNSEELINGLDFNFPKLKKYMKDYEV